MRATDLTIGATYSTKINGEWRDCTLLSVATVPTYRYSPFGERKATTRESCQVRDKRTQKLFSRTPRELRDDSKPPLPGSPLYDDTAREAWADLKEAQEARRRAREGVDSNGLGFRFPLASMALASGYRRTKAHDG